VIKCDLNLKVQAIGLPTSTTTLTPLRIGRLQKTIEKRSSRNTSG